VNLSNFMQIMGKEAAINPSKALMDTKKAMT
jgi:hypothetical protein